MRIRTRKDNRQLREDEVQIESVKGAVSAYVEDGAVTLCTVRGIPGRKAQIAALDPEALDTLIAHLKGLRKQIEPKPEPEPERPRCTCSVSLWAATHLPDCPKGLATGNRYATQEDVPDDVLTDAGYIERHGTPPPVCPDCNTRRYDIDDECSICRLRRKNKEYKEQRDA